MKLFINLFICLSFSIYFSEASIKLSPDSWNFKNTKQGAVISNTIIIKNTSDKILLLFLRADCPCVKINKTEIQIPVNNSEKILITIDTSDYEGGITKKIYFTTNLDDIPAFAFPIKGKVIIDTSFRYKGLFYLFEYNIMFIFPLLIVFFLFFKGITSEKIGGFYKKNIFLIKLMLGLLFLFFTILLMANDIIYIFRNNTKNKIISQNKYLFDSESKLKIALFGSAGCKECLRIKKNILPEYSKNYGDFYDLTFYDLETANNLLYLQFLEKKYNLQNLHSPILVVGTNFIEYNSTFYKNLNHLLLTAISNASVGLNILYIPDHKNFLKQTDTYTEKNELINKLSFYTIAGAGLLDGINPCAFVTIIFLLSYLSLAKRTKKEIFYTGISFTGGVFLTYLLLGFGFYNIIEYFQNIFSFISFIVKYTGAALALTFSVLSFKDAAQAKTGNFQNMSLQLPDFLKKRIHKVIREKTKSRNIIISSFLIGLLVSLFELACTGQVYLPTIIMMLGLTP